MLTFKKFYHSKQLSRETIAFTAEVYWQDRLIGHAENDGGGGWTPFNPVEGADRADISAATDFAKQQTRTYDGTVYNFDSLNEYLHQVAGDYVEAAAHRAWLKRTLKTKVVLLWNGAAYTLKAKWEGNEAQARTLLATKHPGCVILNDRSLAEAEALYLAFEKART